MNRMVRIVPVLAAGLLCHASPAPAQTHPDKVTFGLDWVAEPEYGGYYEALATGLYKKYGLDMTIREGGPQVNNAQLLIAGKIDFDITSNAFLALNFVQQHIPFVAVMAGFQKDPDVLIAHQGAGDDSFAALKGKPIAVNPTTRASWWVFLAHKYGYADSQLRPYAFSLTPFLANRNAVQEGYVTSEPFLVHQATGQWPVVLALPDAGFDGYASLVATSRKLADGDPGLVQRFVQASIAGWYDYLYADPKPAFQAILAANPDMTPALMQYGYEQLKQRGIVDSGDAKTLGIGAMTDTRWQGFYTQMQDAGLYPPGLDWKAAFTTQFVDKGFGTKQAP